MKKILSIVLALVMILSLAACNSAKPSNKENIPGGKQRYWDQVAFDYFPEHYKITVRPCSFDDIVEIDTFNELKQIDKNYAM